MRLWSAGSKRHAKVLVLSVIALQFILPLLPAVWRTLGRTYAHTVDVNKADCTLRCSSCQDTSIWSKLSRLDFISNWPFRSQFWFYEVDSANHSCQRRSELHTSEYTLRDSCPAELEIRDMHSCRAVAEHLEPSLWVCSAGHCHSVSLPVTVLIRSEHQRQLADDNGTVGLHSQGHASQLWQLTDAGDEKFFITSWRGARLQHQSGNVWLGSSKGQEARWSLAQTSGGMLITALPEHQLCDSDGTASLNCGSLSRKWHIAPTVIGADSQWTLRKVDASPDGVLSLNSSSHAASHATFTRPITVTLEIQAVDVGHDCEQYGALQIFGSAETLHTGYTFAVGSGNLLSGADYIIPILGPNTIEKLDQNATGNKTLQEVKNDHLINKTKHWLTGSGLRLDVQGNTTTTLEWTASQWLPVKAILTSSTVAFFVQGKEVASFEDGEHQAGSIKIGGLGQPCGRFEYRNIMVSTPSHSRSDKHPTVSPILNRFVGMGEQPAPTRVQWNADGCTILANIGGQFSGTDLKFCFVLPQLPTQMLAMSLALVVALAFSNRSSSHEQPLGDSGEARARSSFRRGAKRMAMQHELGSDRLARGLLFRMVQTACCFSTIMAYMFTFRPKLALQVLLAVYSPLVVMYGFDALRKPTYFVSPPDFNLFCPMLLSWRGRIHLYYLLALQMATVFFLKSHADMSTYTPVGSPADNRLAWLSLTFQGTWAIRAAGLWGMIHLVCLIAHVGVVLMSLSAGILLFTWPIGRTILAVMLFPFAFIILGPFMIVERIIWVRRWPHDLPSKFDNSVTVGSALLANVDKLAKEIVNMTEQVWSQSMHFDDTLAWLTLTRETPSFRLGDVQPITVIVWKLKCIPTPGQLLKEFLLFLGDIFTDTFAWSNFLSEGHILFAGFLALVTWSSSLIQLRSGMLENLFEDALESVTVGVPTSRWIELLDTEKGLESFVAFWVQLYGFCFAGLSPSNIFVSVASVILSYLGIATYLLDNCDLEFPDRALNKQEEQISTDFCTMGLAWFLEMIMLAGTLAASIALLSGFGQAGLSAVVVMMSFCFNLFFLFLAYEAPRN